MAAAQQCLRLTTTFDLTVTHTLSGQRLDIGPLNVTECSRKSLWPLNSEDDGSSQWARNKHHWACVGMVWERLFISLRSEILAIYAQKCQYNLTWVRDATAVSKEMFVYSQRGQNGTWHRKKSILLILPDILMFIMRVLYYWCLWLFLCNSCLLLS